MKLLVIQHYFRMHFYATEDQKYQEFEVKSQTLKTVANVTQFL
jgi:hypothetical protein